MIRTSLFVLFLGLCPLPVLGQSKPRRPNIVIIVADDLGWADVSMHGSVIKTPNIDRIAKDGAELNHFYVCPVCSPTRAGLMTGRYPIRFGLMRAVIPPWRQGGLATTEYTLAQLLARAGYRHRGVFGKWHLGHSHIKYHPLKRGFTEFVGHYNGAIDYFTHKREGEVDWHNGYKSSRDKGYSTDLIAKAAVEFINRRAKDGPFFCYVPFNAPHSPLQAKQNDLLAYKKLANVGPQFPGKKKKLNGYGVSGRGNSRRQTLAAMIASIDQAIGRILEALQKNGIADDTLVLFFSDNGAVGVGDNRPLRGSKGTVFAGGIRVAAAVRWPGQIPARGKITAKLAYIDVLPTIMRIVGIKKHGEKQLDGIDAWDIFVGKKKEMQRDIYSYIGQGGENQEKICLIEPKWKLIVNGRKITDETLPLMKREILLFDYANDPYEKSNLAAKHRNVVMRMAVKLKAFRSLQLADAVPAYAQGKAGFIAPKDWQIPGR